MLVDVLPIFSTIYIYLLIFSRSRLLLISNERPPYPHVELQQLGACTELQKDGANARNFSRIPLTLSHST